nr:MAG TPA: hypothetical protein [Caudoviricetes sp.]
MKPNWSAQLGLPALVGGSNTGGGVFLLFLSA